MDLKRLATTVSVLASVLLAHQHGALVSAKCTAIGIGRHASADGSVMVAHTNDAGGDASDLRLVRVPAKDHEPGAMRPIHRVQSAYPRIVDADRAPAYAPVDGQNASVPLGEIPEVAHTYAYWDQIYGVINEHQLTIAESTCGARTIAFPLGRTESPMQKGQPGKALFGIEELSNIALERCVSARCAAETMGALAVAHGFYAEGEYADGGEAVFLGDRDGELWMFHVLPSPSGDSAIWAAQRVPSDRAVVMANDFVIQDIDLDDGDNFMHSDNMVTIAESEGWVPSDPTAPHKPKENGERRTLNFFKAFGFEKPKNEDRLLGLYSGRRMWRVFSLLNAEYNETADPTIGYKPSTCENYPTNVKPDAPVDPGTIMKILGDHYEGTPFDLTVGPAAGPFGNPNRYEGGVPGVPVLKGGFERPISIYRTTFSLVSQSFRRHTHFEPEFVSDMKGVAWYGHDQGSGSVWVPVLAWQTALPLSYGWGKQSEFSLDSAWWAFNFVNNWMQLGYNKMVGDMKAVQGELQAEAFDTYANIEDAIKGNGYNREECEATINDMSVAFADKVIKRWWALAFELVAKYANGLVTTGEGHGQRSGPGYPNWWLKDVGYTEWPNSAGGVKQAAQPHKEVVLPAMRAAVVH